MIYQDIMPCQKIIIFLNKLNQFQIGDKNQSKN